MVNAINLLLTWQHNPVNSYSLLAHNIIIINNNNFLFTQIQKKKHMESIKRENDGGSVK